MFIHVFAVESKGSSTIFRSYLTCLMGEWGPEAIFNSKMFVSLLYFKSYMFVFWGEGRGSEIRRTMFVCCKLLKFVDTSLANEN